MKGMSFTEMLKNPPYHDPDYQVEAAKVDFALALERLRQESGIANAGLAARLGTSAAYVTKIFRGDVNFTIESMVRLVHALGGRFDPLVRPASAQPLWRSALESTSVVHPTLRTAKQKMTSPSWFGASEFSPLPVTAINSRNDHDYEDAEAA